MSIDGFLLKHLTNEISEIITKGRISKIYQLSKLDLLLIIRSKRKNHQLMISLSSMYSRIHISKNDYDKPINPPTFCMFLRKHLEGGIIESFSQINNDRIILIDILTTNEIGDKTIKKIYIELMGKHSNFIITDENHRILECIKHFSPFENTQRTMYPGAIYRLPTDTKINPFDDENIRKLLTNLDNLTSRYLVDNIEGLSPLLAKEIIYNFENSTKSIFDTYKHVINREIEPTIIYGKKEYFYLFDLLHIKGERKKYNSLCEMLDSYYFDRDNYERIKQKSKDIDKFIKTQLERNKYKLEKLYTDLENAENREIFKIKGELILANLHNITKGDKSITCLNYYDNTMLTIALDPLLSANDNSQKFFKRYKKFKTAVVHLKKQIDLTIKEIEYFDLLSTQIKNATFQDVLEIKEELENNRYIKKRNLISGKKKKKKPNYDTYIDNVGIEILVGKNNIQNEYITHEFAKKSDTWMHIKDAPGSHVVIRKEGNLDEITIRTAAQLAAYFSKGKLSSSVPIDYTLIKYIKKIPGQKNCFVTYTNNKTIYIDPDDEFIMNLKKK